MKKKLFILAGEASGDLHASMLVRGLKDLESDLDFTGVGGEGLKAEGVDLIYDCSQFSSMGIIEPLLKLSFYRNAFKNVVDYIIQNDIHTVILVDYPGFNLRLAERLKKIPDINIIYYISPQIWAWRYSRIKKVKKFVDAIIVFYPFEEEMYKREGVKACFLGNPLVDIVREKLVNSDEIVIDGRRPCITLLPGSRMSEIKKHLRIMVEAAKLIDNKYSCSFLLPVLGGETRKLVEDELSKADHEGLDLNFIFDNTCRAIEKADLVIACSGTVTLETAIIGKPMIVIYKIGVLSEIAARLLVSIKDISLVNIVAGRRICPELLQKDCTPERIFHQADRLLGSREEYDKMAEEIIRVKSLLGSPGAIDRISKEVLCLISED